MFFFKWEKNEQTQLCCCYFNKNAKLVQKKMVRYQSLIVSGTTTFASDAALFASPGGQILPTQPATAADQKNVVK
jgi:hypothetical protein